MQFPLRPLTEKERRKWHRWLEKRDNAQLNRAKHRNYIMPKGEWERQWQSLGRREGFVAGLAFAALVAALGVLSLLW